ncbi:hypothetical protein BT96DRAFT_1022422 [Gymnopus androsaceus JB14]|uniref:Mid2 domain-containing protein n=1 Tax=Gymnopus androsaceus JB14 TaxID=1447944 RepID=A0A6A4HA97_9AGAR|nr:hypothetical protein BT96DRAFT_1022422 [Gymnopus androsaceus JB14]
MTPQYLPLHLRVFTLIIAFCPFIGLAQTEFRYIDDQYGDSVSGAIPTYEPSEGWEQGSICTECAIHPDAKQAFWGSWHDSTYNAGGYLRSVQFNFTGISLDVFCILPNLSNNDVITTYNLTFNLDNQILSQTFEHESDHDNIFQYNFSVLSLSSLAPVHHTFTMLMATGENSSNTLQFDYARYTVDTDLLTLSSSSTEASTTSNVSPSATISSSSDAGKHSNYSVVIGGTIGGILLVVPTLILIVFCCRRYKHRIRQRFFTNPFRNPDSMRIDPFYSAPPPGVDQPLVPYNRPFIDPPAKNALWRASNVMQVVQDPRAEKRAEVQRRLEEQRRATVVEYVLSPSPIGAADQLNGDGSTSRTSLIVHPDTKTGKKPAWLH